ncbi:flagellar basal body P-ring formation chaperone FlgA [Agrobacterium tumefaciens]|uniref:flagellar basal body P-ring formation chaperone FlgA n=1 Tax=Agrobacterium tumefaciens TaxID=358 RepID=UPI00287CDA4D|nr:flagellar basal body P-ring formation chaperone FlgA [Agrobacterium tumefaciens]MDS7596162.1 flagellar basal body P-ring formation chaperone FlgA [Agrobacterium tumefaciens]
MRFSQKNSSYRTAFVRLFLTSAISLTAMAAAAQTPVALVPTRTIYPGETISPDQVKPVEVTNPNISSGYASDVSEVEGMISKQTLLPGRTIPIAALREPSLVTRGTNVKLVFTIGNMTLMANGTPMTDGSMGDVVRVRNIDSGVIVNGTVMKDGTIQVMAK